MTNRRLKLIFIPAEKYYKKIDLDKLKTRLKLI